MVQSRLSDEWWPYAMRCFCFLRNVVDVLFHGSTAWKSRFGQDFKEAILPFGCEITYLPRSESEKSKLHAFGDKWLQGIFLGYVQQKGGGFANQFLVIDWDDLNKATSVGTAMRQIKQCHHKEVLPVLYNGKHRFPLAEGDLDQPGVTSSITRKIKIRKRKIAEASEAAEKEAQEADAKRRKDLGLPDDPSSANQDFWTCNREFITIHHRTPRTSLFIPTDQNCPFPIKWIDVTRFTQTSIDAASLNKIDDLWFDGTNTVECNLDQEWIGRTRFTLLKPAPPKGWVWQDGRLTKGQKTSRPDNIWPEVWDAIKSKKEKEKLIAQWKNIGPKRYEARKARGSGVPIFKIPESEVEEYESTLNKVIADYSAPPAPALPTMPLAMICKAAEVGTDHVQLPRSRNARRKLAKRQHQERISSSLGGEAF